MLDLIVIGAGSGGIAAAKRAANYGKSVMICENDAIGGTCVNFGCVPKKLWHNIAGFDHQSKIAMDQGWQFNDLTFDWSKVQLKLQTYIQSLSQRYETKCRELKIQIVKGEASFVDANTIQIDGVSYSAKTILIATGSKAEVLDLPGSDLCDTSYEFFSWKTLPKSVAIIGGGYISVELGSILNSLGVDVHVLIRRDLVLRGFDLDIRRKLQELYVNRGINLHKNIEIVSFEKNNDDTITVQLSNNDSLMVDRVIQAVGRVPNTKSLNCQKIGIQCSKNEGLIVNNYQTSVPTIYALGDCIDQIQLTPVAIAQGRQWADMMYSETPFLVSFDIVPTAIFSFPESASVGLSEEQAREKFETVQTKLLNFVPLSLALTDHKEPFFMKVVFQGKNDQVVGIHMIGDGSPEIIQSLTVAMQKGITKADLDLSMALHPTVSEELVTIY